MQVRPRGSRSRPTEKCNLSALLALVVLLAAGAHALAANSIEELLQLDEAGGQNDELRPDLNALTEAQWEYYFKVGRKQTDTALDSQLIERESEKRTSVLYIWVAAIAAGFGMAIGAIKAWPFARHVVKTLTAPVQMEDPGFTISAYAWQQSLADVALPLKAAAIADIGGRLKSANKRHHAHSFDHLVG